MKIARTKRTKTLLNWFLRRSAAIVALADSFLRNTWQTLTSCHTDILVLQYFSFMKFVYSSFMQEREYSKFYADKVKLTVQSYRNQKKNVYWIYITCSYKFKFQWIRINLINLLTIIRKSVWTRYVIYNSIWGCLP